MTRETILQLLEKVQAGETTPSAALRELARLPYEDAGFARIDHHRTLRLGLPEVIYSAGKTPAQGAEIFERILKATRRATTKFVALSSPASTPPSAPAKT